MVQLGITAVETGSVRGRGKPPRPSGVVFKWSCDGVVDKQQASGVGGRVCRARLTKEHFKHPIDPRSFLRPVS